MSGRSISVVVTHYNRPDLLKQALDSISTQTLPPDEILVVDDYSPSDARRKIRAYSNVAIIHEHERNLGLPATLTTGVQLAKNEWVAFLADDDLYTRTKLERQCAYLDQNPECDIVAGPVTKLAPDGSTELWGFLEPRSLNLRDGLVNTAASFQAMLIRRETFLKLGGVTFPYLEDQEFCIRALAAGYRMDILPEPFVTYRHGGHEQLSRQWRNMFRAHLQLTHKYGYLYRREFGRLGTIQMYARLFRLFGSRKGGLYGRLLWAVGVIVQALVGNPFRKWDNW